MTTENNTKINGKFNVNTLVYSIFSLIILAVLSWVGRTTAASHDSIIILQTQQVEMVKNISDIKADMVTKTGLSVELLKLQVPVKLPQAQK